MSTSQPRLTNQPQRPSLQCRLRATATSRESARAADTGAGTVELVIIAPLVILVLMLLTFAGRYAEAIIDVRAASTSAARAASLARSSGEGGKLAKEAANAALGNSPWQCAGGPRVSVISWDKPKPNAGSQVGTADVELTCTIRFSDLTALKVPGQRVVSYRAQSAIEQWKAE